MLAVQPHTMPEPALPSPTLAMLFAEHHARVFRAAYRVTGDAEDAADAMQVVFLRLIHQPAHVATTGDNAAGYLQRAAVNAALDIVRSRGRRRVIPIDDAIEAELSDTAYPPPDPSDPDQLPDYLRQALSRLAPRAAEMFVLHHFEGLANNEIADLFETSANVVGVTLHRTREQLRQALTAQFGGER